MKSAGKPLFKFLTEHLVNRHPRFRRLLLRILVPNRSVAVELCGSRLWINTRKEISYLRAAKSARSNWILQHEISVLTNLALLLEPTDTFVDVGANVGLYAAIVSRASSIFPEMKFYAFEPNPDTVERLRKSLADAHVTIFDYALSDREGELEFCEGADSPTFGVRHVSNSFQIPDRAVRIRTKPLDSVSIDGDSIVLKIDVENHEAEVLRGARHLLDSGRIKAVYVDSFADKTVPVTLETLGFELFEGHTLKPASSSSLLAIHKKHLARWATLRCLSAAS